MVSSPDDPQDDESSRLFREEMKDALRLPQRHYHPTPEPAKKAFTAQTSSHTASGIKITRTFLAEERLHLQPVPMDERTKRSIRKGRTEIDGSLDLHGLTQEAAYHRLTQFIESAQFRGLKHVCVITGRGKEGEGVLRQMLPRWLHEPPLSRIIISFTSAPSHMGGSGAFILHLRSLKLPGN